MRKASLCLLKRIYKGERELLLGLKKKGFGKGKWNGIGGKFEPSSGDSNILDTAIRETEEEIKVKARDLEKVAILDFYYLDNNECDQQVHVFLCSSWLGDPQESDEMKPVWFKEKEIPFDKMWADDRFWLPEILKGEKLEGEFIFKDKKIIHNKNIKIVKNFSKI